MTQIHLNDLPEWLGDYAQELTDCADAPDCEGPWNADTRAYYRRAAAILDRAAANLRKLSA